MSDIHTRHKDLIAPIRAAMYDFDATNVRAALSDVMAADAVVHLAHPIGDLIGPDGFYDGAYAGLLAAVLDLERRDHIVIAGPTPEDNTWVGCGGYYLGTFTHPW